MGETQGEDKFVITEKDVGPAMRRVSKAVGRAIAAYDMIQDGDKILIAVSGGKDSLSLVDLLLYRQTFAPVDYELMAVYIDMNAPNFPVEELVAFFKSRSIRYEILKVDMLQGKTWDDIGCFWCSWCRRKALFDLAGRAGFNKIAFGHHMDDIVETILMNQFFHGEISAMRPKQTIFGGKITLIRPLAFVEERQIEWMIKERNFSRIDRFKCPHHDNTQRLKIRRWLSEFVKEYPTVKKNIMSSLSNVKKEYLL